VPSDSIADRAFPFCVATDRACESKPRASRTGQRVPCRIAMDGPNHQGSPLERPTAWTPGSWWSHSEGHRHCPAVTLGDTTFCGPAERLTQHLDAVEFETSHGVLSRRTGVRCPCAPPGPPDDQLVWASVHRLRLRAGAPPAPESRSGPPVVIPHTPSANRLVAKVAPACRSAARERRSGAPGASRYHRLQIGGEHGANAVDLD
jgi:hypothetical protein